METTTPTQKSIVQDHDGIPMVSSRVVAEQFKKQHKHVIEKISRLGCPADFDRSNFRLVTYTDRKGEQRSEEVGVVRPDERLAKPVEGHLLEDVEKDADREQRGDDGAKCFPGYFLQFQRLGEGSIPVMRKPEDLTP